MKHMIRYSCQTCDFIVEGTTADPQEAPSLICPNCLTEIDFEVWWSEQDYPADRYI